MKGGANKESHPGFFMNPEGDFDPVKPCAYLKEDKKEVEDAEKQDDRYSTDIH